MAMSADNLVIVQSTWVDTTRQSTRLTIKRSMQDAYLAADIPSTAIPDVKTKSGITSKRCRSNGRMLPDSRRKQSQCKSVRILIKESSASYAVSDPEETLRRKRSRRSDSPEPTKHIATSNVQNGANASLNKCQQVQTSETVRLQNLEQNDTLSSVCWDLGRPVRRNKELSQAEGMNSLRRLSQTLERYATSQYEMALQTPAHSVGITERMKTVSSMGRHRQLETIPFVLSAGESLSGSEDIGVQTARRREHSSPPVVSDMIQFTSVEKLQNVINLSQIPQMLPQNHVLDEQTVSSFSEKALKLRISEPIVKMYDIGRARASCRVLEPITPLYNAIPVSAMLPRTPALEMTSYPAPTATAIPISAPVSIPPAERAISDPTPALIEKPDPIMPIPMWCDTRQELCESVPFFRSFQSGCYTYNGVALGYLIDGLTVQSDYIGDNVVISHAGGNLGSSDSGGYQLQSSQESADKAIKALISNQKRATPLVLVLGDNCPISPVNVPHRYCVMDWFLVTHAWEDLDQSTRDKSWKFRLERIDRTAKPWWHNPKNTKMDLPVSEIDAHRCSDCTELFPQIYKQGYMCLNGDCSQFWKVNGQEPADKLQYNEDFLALASLDHRGPMPFDLLALPHVRDALSVRGWHCHKCGKLNCREAWEGWICSSPGCDEKSLILDRVDNYLSRRGRGGLHPTYTGTPISTDVIPDESIVTVSSHTMDFGIQGCYRVMKYEVKDVEGTIYHVIPNKTLCEFANGPDDILKEYKSVMSIFRRYPLQNTKLPSRTLAQYFAHNAGAHYKSCETLHKSTPFYLCPKAIPMVLNFMQAIVRAEGIPACDQFNEVLSIAYVECQRIGYHSDSEADIGATIASISLGSRAVMKFRKKVATSRLHNSSGQEMTNAENMLLWSDIDTDDGIIPTCAAPSNARKSGPGPILQLELGHGDVVIMHGTDIQRRLVHSVIPTGEFTIAATVRYVKEN
ncbi:2OG-Fe(II) oxygenase superfamily-domain-containing protein [Lipomyces mesembrius]